MAIVGSGPGSLDNAPGFIDGHELVVRVNNYKLRPETGFRCDVFASFFGHSIKKTAEELQADGVRLCLCKCPDSAPIRSAWHDINDHKTGTDFRWIYELRKDFWFCDTYIPETADFLESFEMMGRHILTTGFAAILEVLRAEPASVYLTGFDFFRSGLHNVDEPWREKHRGEDPIGHVPERERAWLSENWARHPLSGDPALMRALETAVAA